MIFLLKWKAAGRAARPSGATDSASWSELDSPLDEKEAGAEGLREGKDWAQAEREIRKAEPHKKTNANSVRMAEQRQ